MRTTLLPILLFASTAMAQQAIPASGGEAGNTTGSSSYTIGQVAWTEAVGQAGTVAQGVQQAYTILSVSITEPLDPAMVATVGPNPTSSGVVLRLAGTPPAGTTCQLLSASGSLVRSIPVTSSEQHIAMDDLPAATYLLSLLEGELPIHIVKIFKH